MRSLVCVLLLSVLYIAAFPLSARSEDVKTLTLYMTQTIQTITNRPMQ